MPIGLQYLLGSFGYWWGAWLLVGCMANWWTLWPIGSICFLLDGVSDLLVGQVSFWQGAWPTTMVHILLVYTMAYRCCVWLT